MHIDKLLYKVSRGKIPSSLKKSNITAISSDSRTVTPGSLFFALAGSTYNGASFIEDAVARGAKVVVRKGRAKDPILLKKGKNAAYIIEVSDPHKSLREVARRFYANPSKTVKAIGITGTNGKTTVSYLIESILRQAKRPCGVVGTINYRAGSKTQPSLNTTPGLLENQHFLSLLRKKKIKYCVMEVSSHALDQGRVDLIDFQCAVFTNLTSDHLDYHGTTENYFQAKAKLFRSLSPQAYAAINTDDPCGKRLSSMTKAKVITYGVDKPADVKAEDIVSGVNGSRFILKMPRGTTEISTALIGKHNLYNILGACSAAWANKIRLQDIKKGIESFRVVPGRLERIDCGQNFSVFVDYAHTEDGLKNVLSSLRAVAKAAIILVFGCGGDRDKTKRPKMGRVGSALADHVILTNDNPRSEEPEVIVDEIIKGFSRNNFEVMLDREQAIGRALRLAQEGDIVLIAGKGHEDYQIFKDRKIHFDDRETVRKILTELQDALCR